MATSWSGFPAKISQSLILYEKCFAKPWTFKAPIINKIDEIEWMIKLVTIIQKVFSSPTFEKKVPIATNDMVQKMVDITPQIYAPFRNLQQKQHFSNAIGNFKWKKFSRNTILLSEDTRRKSVATLRHTCFNIFITSSADRLNGPQVYTNLIQHSNRVECSRIKKNCWSVTFILFKC